MYNQISIIGKVKEEPILKELSSGTKMATMLVEVERAYKSSTGEVETDLFNVILWRNVAEESEAICKKDNLIGIFGRLQANNYTKDDNTYYKSDVICERLNVIN